MVQRKYYGFCTNNAMRLLSILIFITACNLTKKPAFREITDDNYTIQVMPLQKNENGSTGYKVRISPKERVLDEAGKQLQDILWYKTDSCFYMTKDNADIQPELVQPVASGIANCYEYMVLFNDEIPSLSNGAYLEFVFNDRHITREKYIIRL
jgi:hypothetical protein